MSNAAEVIQLPEDLQAFAEERVRAGEYASVGEVTNAAFRLLQRRDERRHEVREELGGIFREMEQGTYLEPSDEEFAQAVRERALNHTGARRRISRGGASRGTRAPRGSLDGPSRTSRAARDRSR